MEKEKSRRKGPQLNLHNSLIIAIVAVLVLGIVVLIYDGVTTDDDETPENQEITTTTAIVDVGSPTP